MKISTVEQMRALDRTAIEQYAIPEGILMENAGLAVFQVLSECYGISDRRFVIFCGGGNNGGDGFVVARKIHSNGGDVRVFLLADPSKFQGAAGWNLDIIRKTPIEIRQIHRVEDVLSDLAHSDVVIDAIFGTGLTREVGGIYREVIQSINQSEKPVVSVDIPSGIDGDTGEIRGIAIHAHQTVTFGLPKIGNLFYPGYRHGGRLFVTHISFPPSMIEAADIRMEINSCPPLPERNPDGHKGSFGQALFVAGATNYYGAPLFAAYSFLKSGGGYSRLATPASLGPVIGAGAAEVVVLPMAETQSGAIAYENRDRILAVAENMDIVVLGPGISLDPETARLIRELCRRIEKPLIIDGDGISAVCENLDCIQKRRFPTVLTPHPGEMAKICKETVPTLLRQRPEQIRNHCRDLGAEIVVKGAHTLIGSPDGTIRLNTTGNAGMGTAGSGDVLTGVIAACYCLGLEWHEALGKGVYLHGLAGDLAAANRGEDGITARDILDLLPEALQQDRAGRKRKASPPITII